MTHQMSIGHSLPQQNNSLLPKSSAEKSIITIVNKLKNRSLDRPYFQRDFVWDRNKIIQWMETLFNYDSVGTLVTYQLSKGDDRRVFIADGYQRIQAATRYIDDPLFYSSDLSSNQVKEKLQDVSVMVQHMIYSDHGVAIKAFQNLNKGTILTAYEYFKGYLTKDPVGTRVDDKIPSMVAQTAKEVITQRNPGRAQEHINNRAAFAMFLQYHSKYKLRTLWPVAQKETSGPGKIVEEELSNWLSKNTSLPEIDKLINQFGSFLALTHQTIKALRDEVGMDGIAMSITLYHWLIFFNIYRKNNNIPTLHYNDLVKRMLESQKGYENISTRFEITRASGKKVPVSLSTSSVGMAYRISRELGGKLTEEEGQKSSKVVDYGMDNSHILPISEYGDGITFPEPSSKNRARGAISVNEKDLPKELRDSE